jgi:hypothetical protein
VNEDEYLDESLEDADLGEEFDFTDEDGEEHNAGEYQ